MTGCAEIGCTVPHGIAECHCSQCHEMFSGPSAFGKHQKFPEGGKLTCRSPASVGLVLREAHGRTAWAWPEREGARDWVEVRRGERG